jgi:hypothetical protein
MHPGGICDFQEPCAALKDSIKAVCLRPEKAEIYEGHTPSLLQIRRSAVRRIFSHEAAEGCTCQLGHLIQRPLPLRGYLIDLGLIGACQQRQAKKGCAPDVFERSHVPILFPSVGLINIGFSDIRISNL